MATPLIDRLSRHKAYGGFCTTCKNPEPCDSMMLLAALQELALLRNQSQFTETLAVTLRDYARTIVAFSFHQASEDTVRFEHSKVQRILGMYEDGVR